MNKNIFIKNLFTVSIALAANSCSTVKYHAVTAVNSDGSFLREIYTKPDSLFLKGDMTKNPYLFELDSNWKISEVANVNSYPFLKAHKSLAKISSRFNSFEDYARQLRYSENMRPVAAPAESLKRQFRWFYTYYTFSAVYSSVSDRIPVSIDTLMSKEEQEIWFSNNHPVFNGMNGFEMYDELDDIETKFMEWYFRNTFEISFRAVEKYAGETDNNPFVLNISDIKDTLFITAFAKKGYDNDYQPKLVCQLLDEYLKTDYFSKVYSANSKAITNLYEEQWAPVEVLMDKGIKYDLIMPGKIIESNTALRKSDTLVWRVDVLRLIPGDYTLLAQSRSVNVWAFAVTALLAVVAIYCMTMLIGRRN